MEALPKAAIFSLSNLEIYFQGLGSPNNCP